MYERFIEMLFALEIFNDGGAEADQLTVRRSGALGFSSPFFAFQREIRPATCEYPNAFPG